MALFYKTFLLGLFLIVCFPATDYASFPVKRVITTNSAAAGKTEAVSNRVGEIHKNTFGEKVIGKVSHFAERLLEPTGKSIAMYLAVVSAVFGGLGIQRFYLGYIGYGILQLLGIGCLVGGVILIMAAIAGTGAGLLIPGFILCAAWVFTWIWSIVDIFRIGNGSLRHKTRTPSSLLWYR
jgi:TM2 domain-containing protein